MSTTSVSATSASTASVSKSPASAASESTASVSTSSASTASESAASVSVASVPTSSLLTSSVSTTSVSTASVSTASVSTSSLLTSSVSTSSVLTASVPTSSVSTTQFHQDTGRTTTGTVYAYISVPVLVVVVVAIILVVMIILKRKRRRNGDKYSCFRRKKVENYRFQAATNKTYNVNSLNGDDACIRYSPENVRNSVSNMYAEIAFSSTQSIKTSKNAENGHSTFSVGVPKGQYEAGAREIIGTYDTLHTNTKANTIQISDCFQSAYDHVIVGNHKNQSTRTDEYSHYSNLDAVQINNVKQTHFRILDNQNQTDNRSDRSSTHCDDQDDRSHHEYVILEPGGHSIVQE